VVRVGGVCVCVCVCVRKVGWFIPERFLEQARIFFLW